MTTAARQGSVSARGRLLVSLAVGVVVAVAAVGLGVRTAAPLLGWDGLAVTFEPGSG